MRMLSILAICLALSYCAAGAGSPPDSGDIHGCVLTASGTGIPGVSVTIESNSPQPLACLVSGDGGVFHAGGLPAGAYRVRACLQGFEPAVAEGVVVSAGQGASVNLSLGRLAFAESVTVTATVPGTGLEYASIRDSGARDVGEALPEVAGVWMQRRGAIGNDVSIRGQHNDNVAVLIDGAPLHGACPNRMDPPAFHVDFAEVERVEVGKGPFEVATPGAVAGVLNVVTAAPVEGLHGRLSMSGGRFGYVNPAAAVSYGQDRWALLGGYSWRRSGVYQDGGGKPFTDVTNYLPGAEDLDAFDIQTGWLQASLEPFEGHVLELGGTRQMAEEVLYPGLQMDAVSDDADRLNLRYNIRDGFGPLGVFRFQAYGNRVRHWMTDSQRTSGLSTPRGYSMGTDAESATYGGRITSSRAALRFGLEASRRSWDTVTVMARSGYTPQASIPDVISDNAGGWLSWEHSFADQVRLRMGGRFDYGRSAAAPGLANTNLYWAYQNSRSTKSVDLLPSGFISATWGLAGLVEVQAGLGHSARLPDPQELFFALKRMGSDWVGNPALKPTRMTGLETGARFRQGALTAAITAYYQFLTDYITVYSQPRRNPVPGIMNTAARSYGNVPARIWGSEADLALALGDRWFLSGDLAWVTGRKSIDNSLGLESTCLAEIPPLTAHARLRYDTGRFFGQLEAEAATGQDRVDTDLQEQPTPGYGIINFSVGGEYKAFRAVLTIDNLTDRQYWEHFSYRRDPFASGARVPEPGLGVSVNVQYRF